MGGTGRDVRIGRVNIDSNTREVILSLIRSLEAMTNHYARVVDERDQARAERDSLAASLREVQDRVSE